MSTRRVKKVGALIREEISDIIRKQFPAPESCLFSVTEVGLTADLKTARVYLSIYAEEEQGQSYFKKIAGGRKAIRKELFSRVHLRYVPELEFIMDRSIAEGDRVLKIFRAIEQEKQDEPDKNDS